MHWCMHNTMQALMRRPGGLARAVPLLEKGHAMMADAVGKDQVAVQALAKEVAAARAALGVVQVVTCDICSDRCTIC